VTDRASRIGSDTALSSHPNRFAAATAFSGVFRNRETHATTPAREIALDCLAAGIRGADPEVATRTALSRDGQHLTLTSDDGTTSVDLDRFDDILVLGGGKAVTGVVRTLDDLLGGHISGGLVVVPEETPEGGNHIGAVEVAAGGHPVPTEAGAAATGDLLECAEAAGQGTLVLGVMTGGGSALLAAPAGALSVEHLQGVTRDLLDAGAEIGDINAVRKHVSAVKGGRLAAACAPAEVLSIAVSDVVGDPLPVIASGPTAPDETTYGDASAVLDRYGIDAPEVRAHLERGAESEFDESPGPDAALFENVRNHVVASNRTALDAAARAAEEDGFEPCVLSSRVQGEAAAAAPTHVAIAAEAAASGDPVSPPAVILSGGETTVDVGDKEGKDDGGEIGDGGPNTEFALAAALELCGGTGGHRSEIVVAAVDTDGRDGSTDAAGALVDAGTVTDPEAVRDALARHDSVGYIDQQNAALRTGATGTNVNDLRVLVVTDP
jgi:glycerate 2-kinase